MEKNMEITIKNIQNECTRKPSFSLKLGKGLFMATEECPNCGSEDVYFDGGLGCYVCPYCDWKSKGYY